MNILLCNDDGLYSDGILLFAKKLSAEHNVTVVAPERNNSAVSHSLSIFKNIRVKEEKIDSAFRSFSVSGTPADCVKFAHHNFRSFFPFDAVLSGINKGHNLGTDTLYSGTVSAAFEGAALGYKAIAFSCVSHDGEFMEDCADIACDLLCKLYPRLTEDFIFNVNIPARKKEEIAGVKLTPLGKQIYSDNYEALSDGEFALTGEMLAHGENDSDCDVELSRAGFVTVTPMICDRTAYGVLNALKDIVL